MNSILLEIVRAARDYAYYAATYPKRSTTVMGVRLSLNKMSPRMRYVMMRGYESEDAELARALLTPDDVVIEAGCAIGFMAIFCKKIIGVKRHVMIEANPQLGESIVENFRLNGIQPDQLISAAVAAEDGKISFGVNRNFWSSSTLERAGESRITVTARSLPSLVAEMDVKPNVLVMDIEGSEASIPPEHFDLFDKLLIETHPKLVGQPPIDKLLSSICELGFEQVGRIGGSFSFRRR